MSRPYKQGCKMTHGSSYYPQNPEHTPTRQHMCTQHTQRTRHTHSQRRARRQEQLAGESHGHRIQRLKQSFVQVLFSHTTVRAVPAQ
jgi:hypothetical protein